MPLKGGVSRLSDNTLEEEMKRWLRTALLWSLICCLLQALSLSHPLTTQTFAWVTSPADTSLCRVLVASAPHSDPDDLPYRYGFSCCESNPTAATHDLKENS
jgi:hypothetical protein